MKGKHAHAMPEPPTAGASAPPPTSQHLDMHCHGHSSYRGFVLQHQAMLRRGWMSSSCAPA